MDFKDGGAQCDPTINTDADTLNQNEPIISFSPERCRFDSGQTSRKSSTSFPISVSDLEDSIVTLHQMPANANNCNSVTSTTALQGPLTQPTVAVPTKASIHLHNSLAQQPPHQTSVFANVPKQAYPFLPISTHSTTASLSSTTPPVASHTKPGLLPAAASSDGAGDLGSGPLMVNGTTLALSSSTLDLQKRLEKRIAQASAAAALSSSSTAQLASSSSSISSSSFPIATNANPFLPDIPSASSTSLASVTSTSLGNGNQISFSPPNSMSSSTSTTLWESGTALDSWDNGNMNGVDEALSLEDENTPPQQQQVGMDEFVMESEVTNQVPPQPEGAKPKPGDKGSPSGSGEPEIAKLVLTTCPPTTASASGSTCNASGVGSDSKPGRSSRQNSKSLRNNNHNNNTTNNSSISGVGPSSTSATNFQSASTTSSALPPASVTVVNPGFDIRKVSALLPPQRLAIPTKSNPQLQSSQSNINRKTSASSCATSTTGLATAATPTSYTGGTILTFSTSQRFSSTASSSSSNNPSATTNTCSTTSSSIYGLTSSTTTTASTVHKTSTRNASISESSCNNNSSSGMALSGNGNVKAGSNSSKLSSEKKPLVQWDSDESEEELSFFPPAKRGVITDNLSIDNMSLSGEEEDLHLTPPRPLSKKCPCDPRSWMERNDIPTHHHGDSRHVISTKHCVIS